MEYPAQIRGTNPPAKLQIAKNDLFPDRLYIESLQKGIHLEKVILYGSYAQGHPHPESDLDLAVISPDFGG